MNLLADEPLAFLLAIARLTPLATCAALLFELFRRRTGSVAHALLLAFLALQVIAVLQIELLSLATAYRPWPVTLLWALCAAAAFLGIRRGPRIELSSEPWSGWERAVAAACAVLLAGTLVTAIRGAPNTWDALSYHLPRAMHWIQNSSIEHFATSNSRQTKFSPLAEILVSQTVLLSGGDRLVNLVQWSAYGAAAVAIYAGVRGAGLSRLAGLSGALMFLAVPIAVLQASGPKNDLVLTANLATAVVAFRAGFGELRWGALAAGAAALGLAVLSKGTGFIFGGILAALLVAAVLFRHGAKRCAAVVALLVAVLFMLNAGHFFRNLRRYGSWIGPPNPTKGFQAQNQRLDLPTFAWNVTRNAALHLTTPSRELNRSVDSAIGALHGPLGLPIDDPASTWPDGPLEPEPFPSVDEDRSGNPLQFLAICFAFAAAPWTLRATRHAGFATIVGCGLLLGAAAFCLLLKWQPWHSRLHLPLFAVGSLFVALAFWRRPRALVVALLLMVAASLPALLANRSRPLVGKKSVLRQSRAQGIFRADEAGANMLARRLAELRPARIGLRLGYSEPEYLIWVVARKVAPGVRLDHVGTSRPLPPRAPGLPPIDTVVTYDDPYTETRLSIEGATYRLNKFCGRFTVWRREGLD